MSEVLVIQPGATGVDFSYSKPPPEVLLRDGYSFVVGYVSPNQRKNLLNPRDYIAAGLGVIYVFEISATRPNLGFNAGLEDGRFAREWLQGCGYPVEVSIIVAFDTNTSAANLAAHRAYWEGFKQTAAPYTIGAYEDTDLAAYTDAETTVDWLPLAWSWSGPSLAEARRKAFELGYHVYQLKGYWIDNQWAVDPNQCIRPFRTWGTPKAAPTPVPEEDEDMKLVYNIEGQPGIWLKVAGDDPIAFASIEDAQEVCGAINAVLEPRPTLSVEQHQRFFKPPVVVNVPPIPAARVAITVSQV